METTNQFKWQQIDDEQINGGDAASYAIRTTTYSKPLPNGMLIRVRTLTTSGACTEAIVFVPKSA